MDRTVSIVGPVQVAGANGLGVNFQPAKASAIVIANKIIYSKGLIYIGTGGDVAVIPAGNSDASATDPIGWVVFKSVPDGTFLPIYVVRVGDIAAGTTATNIIFCS
jgi:hypothetical protein